MIKIWKIILHFSLFKKLMKNARGTESKILLKIRIRQLRTTGQLFVWSIENSARPVVWDSCWNCCRCGGERSLSAPGSRGTDGPISQLLCSHHPSLGQVHTGRYNPFRSILFLSHPCGVIPPNNDKYINPPNCSVPSGIRRYLHSKCPNLLAPGQ